MKQILLVILVVTGLGTYAQRNYWQQRIKYDMNVALDVNTHKITGNQKIEYWNNSNDTLKKLFFHMYWNAFRPNSQMDVRSRELGRKSLRTDKHGNNIPDWDSRVRDRISKLETSETGSISVTYLTLNGRKQMLREHETILEVVLDKPILPCTKVQLETNFEARVPIMIRRAGRNSAEGVKYSIAQWFPKMAEYDENGWNANPYIAREFHGVWGDFNVKITTNRNYTIAGTGVLQNPYDIGHGYTPPGHRPARPNASNTLTWHFVANNVHDFAWAADDEFQHITRQVSGGPTLHAFYKTGTQAVDSAWANVLWMAEKVLPYIEKRFGKYPWPQYSFIEAGDGGMEYAMCTFMRGPGLGLAVHEWMHSWYQQLLATNESLYAWMDEGFTSFAENEVMHHFNTTWAHQSPYVGVEEKNRIAKSNENTYSQFPLVQADNYLGYFSIARSPYEEPLSTHADHFSSNMAYSSAAYSKGAVFITQLGYIIGDSLRDRTLINYYNQWKFKHPTPNDFIRAAELTSGLELQWYKEYWVNSTRTIDYALGSVNEQNGKAVITLRRVGAMPMPIDVLVTYKDGSKELYNIPLDMMYGSKPVEGSFIWEVKNPWKWTVPHYDLVINRRVADIKEVDIDPSHRMADLNRSNNKLVIPD